MAHKRKRNSSGMTVLLSAVTLLLSLTFCFAACSFIDKLTGPKDPSSGPEISLSDPVEQEKEHESDVPGTTAKPDETTQPTQSDELGQVVSSATISSQGDLLIHKPIIDCSYKGGAYDFEAVFRYLKPYTDGYDYAVANLETTFGGVEFPYQGFPQFNCPDAFAGDVAEAGFDMLLTANNHAATPWPEASPVPSSRSAARASPPWAPTSTTARRSMRWWRSTASRSAWSALPTATATTAPSSPSTVWLPSTMWAPSTSS